MREFHMTLMAALSTPINAGFALIAWHLETHPWARFERTTAGYVGQEVGGRIKDKG